MSTCSSGGCVGLITDCSISFLDISSGQCRWRGKNVRSLTWKKRETKGNNKTNTSTNDSNLFSGPNNRMQYDMLHWL